MATGTYTVYILGDAGVGKTTLVKRHANVKVADKRAHDGSVVWMLSLPTGDDLANFRVIEQASGPLKRVVDAVMLIFDVDDKDSYSGINQWYTTVANQCKVVPVVLAGNKIDVVDERHAVSPDDITVHGELGIPYYEMSVITGCNYDQPFIDLLRTLTNNPKLELASPEQVEENAVQEV